MHAFGQKLTTDSPNVASFYISVNKHNKIPTPAAVCEEQKKRGITEEHFLFSGLKARRVNSQNKKK